MKRKILAGILGTVLMGTAVLSGCGGGRYFRFREWRRTGSLYLGSDVPPGSTGRI